MPILLLVRHGQSLWNAENRFTGWKDIDLSFQGEKEAQKAGKIIQRENISFDISWTSFLKRAYRTLNFILKELNKETMPIYRSWRLNERHYGQLQGFNKNDIRSQHGKDQVFKWRRSFDISPPKITGNSPDHPAKDPLYKNIPPHLLPRGESLKETMNRVLPLWHEKIKPQLEKEKNILIVAHGNSLRSIVKHIKKINDAEISNFEIPTATPLKIQWDSPQSIQNKPKIFQFLKITL